MREFIRKLFDVVTGRDVSAGGSGSADEMQFFRLDELERRVVRLENRLINYYRNRWDAIDNLADYLVNAEVGGEYLEFGVFQGTTFSYAFSVMSSLFKDMRFIAFDSFEGLPEPRGIDAEEGFTSGFYKGQFACSEKEFTANLEKAGVDLRRAIVIRGWFDQTLTPETANQCKIRKIAAAWIDCDLYESTVPVLRFITPFLSVGTVILFDDWRCFRNLPDFGQQRACREWLAENPHIRLRQFISFGFHGQSFTVRSC